MRTPAALSNCRALLPGVGPVPGSLPPVVSRADRHGPRKGSQLPCADSPAATPWWPIIQGHGSQRPRWCPWCRSSTAGSWCRRAESCRRADHRPCRGAALRREAGARGAMPIIQGHALASWCRSSTLPEAGTSCASNDRSRRRGSFSRSREGRARQYESIILRNWPECGHRRRVEL